jgi:O-antigen ligase
MLLFFRRDKVSLLARGAGFTTFLLSSVRAAWGSLVLALVLLAFREKKYIGKLIGAAAVLALCTAAAMAIDPVRERIQDRFLSFTDMKSDTSYQDRTSGYGEMARFVEDSPLGSGLGTMDALFQGKTALGTRDSGIWEIVMSLGWVGGAIYFAALGLLASYALSTKVTRSREELLAACISVGLLAQIPMGSVTGVTGITIWTFGAIAIAPLASAEIS